MVTLYVYVDGFDLTGLETDLVERFTEFVAAWNISTARVVNDRRQSSVGLREGDLP